MGMQLDRGDSLNSEINITPFVDVVLVLLVIFMVTTPLMQKAAELELPKTTLTKTLTGTEPLLEIDHNGHVSMNGKRVPYSKLQTFLESNTQVQSAGVINIAAHSSLPYEFVFRTMEAAQLAGITRVLLAGQEAEKADLSKLDAEADRRRAKR